MRTQPKEDDIIERLLIGAAPNERVPKLPGSLRSVSARVRALFDADPALRSELERDMATHWKEARGDRGAFAQRIAERRAQLISRAETHVATTAIPAAIERSMDEVQRYMSEVEGRSRAP